MFLLKGTISARLRTLQGFALQSLNVAEQPAGYTAPIGGVMHLSEQATSLHKLLTA